MSCTSEPGPDRCIFEGACIGHCRECGAPADDTLRTGELCHGCGCACEMAYDLGIDLEYPE